jgi:predicted small integral membrane protein
VALLLNGPVVLWKARRSDSSRRRRYLRRSLTAVAAAAAAPLLIWFFVFRSASRKWSWPLASTSNPEVGNETGLFIGVHVGQRFLMGGLASVRQTTRKSL